MPTYGNVTGISSYGSRDHDTWFINRRDCGTCYKGTQMSVQMAQPANIYLGPFRCVSLFFVRKCVCTESMV